MRGLKGRVERQEMTVTAQLMPGHEMALPQIMTERALEKEKERRNSSDLDRMLGGSWRVGGGLGVCGEEIRADTVKSIHDSLFRAAAQSSPPSLDVSVSLYVSLFLLSPFFLSPHCFFFSWLSFSSPSLLPPLIYSMRSLSVFSKAPSFLFTLSSFIRSINLYLLFSFSSLLSHFFQHRLSLPFFFKVSLSPIL